MSSLRTRSKTWPFFTVSPRRARMSTMRPEASEITGTVRAMSGNTEPVTNNCDGAWYSVAVTIGYRSGCSTAKKETSTPETTLAGGGASASTFTLSLLQPLITRCTISTIGSSANPIALLFTMIPAPLCLSAIWTPGYLQIAVAVVNMVGLWNKSLSEAVSAHCCAQQLQEVNLHRV